LILGVGVGGEHKKEFEACGVPVAQRGSRTDESLAVLKLLWTTDGASFRGRFWSFENASMNPKPLQKPHPPIWVGGRSDAALRRAAKFGDGWIGIFVTPDRYRESLLKLEGFKREERRGVDNLTAAHNLFTYTAATYDQARDAAAEYLSRNYAMPFGPFEKYCTLGTPRQCVESIRKYVDAGARHIVLRITATGETLLDQLNIYLNEILPHFTK